MIERIEAWLRARDAARFKKDMDQAGDSVEDFGDKAEKSGKKTGVFRKETDKLQDSLKGVRVNIGPFSMGIKTMIGLAATGAPILASLAGSIISIGASAGAAVAGGGIVAGAGLTAMLAGMSGMFIITKQASEGLKDIKTAQDAYNLALAQHGRWSTEALRAQEKLNAVVEVSGGRAALKAVRAWDRLGASFAKATKPARAAMFAIANNGIEAATRLLPTFASQTNKNAAVIRKSLSGAFSALSGPEMEKNIRVFSRMFRSMMPSLSSGGTDFIIGLMRVFRAAGPAVIQFSKGFASVGASFRSWSSNGKDVNRTVSMLVGHFRSWWNLLKSVGSLTSTVFKLSQREGKGLVDSLTGVINGFNDWLKSAEGQEKGLRFFKQSAEALKSMGRALTPVMKAIGQLSAALLPALTSGAGGFGAVMDILILRLNVITDVLRFLGPAVGPLVVGFMAWKTAIMLLTGAQIALNIAQRLSPIGLIITGVMLLVGAFILAYKKVEWFRNGVNAVINFVKDHWKTLLALIPVIGPILSLVAHNFDKVKAVAVAVFDVIKSVAKTTFGVFKSVGTTAFNAVKDSINFVKGAIDTLITALQSAVEWVKNVGETVANTPGVSQALDAASWGAGAVGDVGGGLADAGGAVVGFLGGATGGEVRAGSRAIVGEEGPELVDRTGGRTRIIPLNPPIAPISLEQIGGSGSSRPMIAVVHLNGREIARAVAQDTDDRIARR